ncbi:4e0438f3-a21a-4ddb-96ce-2bb24df7defd [Thermothielavioides terrestris]|uniref:4e0438f3-a21a-4ddb-96ce-2bb24df7defd n=1 Tax=Thermothielavioides terrestris TaxID=2587410 RepID=A0A446B889_9PEZI|nr:4e0438f3-a21a-4ddb-96ce-2bb24df7defd [Thermothielavioides terrestris]
MGRSSVLVRLSGRKQGDQSSTSNGNGVRREAPQNSWRRRSLASLSRKLPPGLKPRSPSTAIDPVVVQPVLNDDDDTEEEPQGYYPKPVEVIRQEEYPHMNQGVYLDHGGTTIYARATIERTTAKLLANLYGNPHSANRPAALSGDVVDGARARALRFLGADPRHFDLVFAANATAAIKLVADAFRDLAARSSRATSRASFWYGYHRDAHTSLVGVRELAGGDHHVFADDEEVEAWLDGGGDAWDGGGHGNGHWHGHGCGCGHGAAGEQRGRGGGVQRLSSLGLFAYPGQSNLTGRRLPLEWAGRLRRAARARRDLRDTYSLLDAAALAMTSPMAEVFADPEAAPDFVCVSFYKIFGFPDLGGLVVRRDSGHILALRKYFGGGTVSMVSTISGAWHLSKGLERTAGAGGGEASVSGALHEGLEDGTLPFHSILALGEAIDVHAELFGSMQSVSAHTTALARRMYRRMKRLRHYNGQPLCEVYGDGEGGAAYGDARRQGATIAFNVFRADGGYESYATVEKLANESPNGLSLINELPTGVVRVSLGAMSTIQDVDKFLAFLHDAFTTREDSAYGNSNGGGSAASVKSEPGEGYG